MIKIAYFLFIVIILSSCQSKENTKKEFRDKIKVLKSVSIPLDSLTPRPIFSPQLVKNKYLIFLNSKANSLDMYDLEAKNLFKRIKLVNEGENATGKIYQFLYHNADSIFVVNSYQYKVFLVDETGKVKEKYSLIKQKKHSATTAMPNIFPFNHPPVFIDNQLHIASAPDDNPYQDSFYRRNALSIILDLKNKEVFYNYSFPENYRKNIYPTNKNAYCRVYIPDLNKFFYSFFIDEYIRIVSTDYKREIKYKAIPNDFSPIKSLSKRITDVYEDSNVGNSMPSFVHLTYNPFQKTTYRVLQIPSVKNNTIQEDKFTVILLGFDEKFNKIKEIKFTEKSIQNPFNTFFTPEGMWIQRVTDNEDELVYDLVEFVAE